MACHEEKKEGSCSTNVHNHGEGDCSKEKCCIFSCIVKILSYALIFAIISCGVGYSVWHVIFGDAVMADEFVDLWRPMDAKEWKLMPLSHFITGICFSVVFCALYKGLDWCMAPGACKGAKFGMLIALIPAIGCSLTFYITQPISPLIAFACFTNHFFSLVISGAVVGAIHGMCHKKKEHCKK